MVEQKISNKELYDALHSLIRAMIFDQWTPDYIVGFASGIVPATMLGKYLQKPVYSLDDDCSNGWMAEDAFGYGKDKTTNILIVTDENLAGINHLWIKADWQNACLPNDPRWSFVWGHNVRFATIVNNRCSQFQDIDYSALEVDTDEKDQKITFPWENWWEYEPSSL